MPWSSILILPSGDFKICCFTGHIPYPGASESHGIALDENGVAMNVLTHSVKDAMNSVYHRELRLAQSKNERHAMCKVCWDRDNASDTQGVKQTSMRVVRSFYQTEEETKRVGGLAMQDAVTMDKAPQIMAPDGSIDMMPMSLDIRFSNLCNAKCIMCEPLYSNLWYEDHIKLYGREEFNAGHKTYKINKTQTVSGKTMYHSDMDKWNDDPRWWAQFDEMAPHLRHIYVTGGEPFVQPTHDKFIKKLVELGYAKNIVLEYDTNLSVLNPKILTMLGEFKDLIFRISVDDVGEQYNLIRYPLNFDRLVKNLKTMEEYGFRDKIVNLTSCVGIHSIYSPLRIHKFFSEIGYDKYVFRLLRSPEVVDIANLPRAAKEKVIEDYEKSDLPAFYQAYVVGYLKNNLDKYTDKEANAKMLNYTNWMNSMDKIRGTDWKSTLPEVVDLILGSIKK
jgi:hypothetical protein